MCREASLLDVFLVGETLPFDVIVCATGFTIESLAILTYKMRSEERRVGKECSS